MCFLLPTKTTPWLIKNTDGTDGSWALELFLPHADPHHPNTLNTRRSGEKEMRREGKEAEREKAVFGKPRY